MSFFKNNDGILNVIRCDEPEYLIWKWAPKGTEKGNNIRENSIRWGSSLRVKDGEVAVFVYKQKKEQIYQDFIEGPFDEIIKTKNFPVLSNLLGLAYNGNSPFQAEIYFINLAKIIQIKFAAPFFDVFDPRFIDFSVPVAVRGTMSFRIGDYKEFIKLHRLINYNLDSLKKQIRDVIIKQVKGIVSNYPSEHDIPVIQLERKIVDISKGIEDGLKERVQNNFGVIITGIDIESIEIDKTGSAYSYLKSVTQDIVMATAKAQAEADIKNIKDMQRINVENVEATLKYQREEAQYAQHKRTQSSNLNAFKVEQQAEVGVAGANALGNMGNNGATEIHGDNMNPVGMMAGMAMAGTIGHNMANMMGEMMKEANNQPLDNPPPIPLEKYYVAVGEQATGPYDTAILYQMVQNNILTKSSLVWKNGMSEWKKVEEIKELSNYLFVNSVT